MHQLKTNSNLQGGKYIIERVLGQGGFGNTYVGVNTVFNDTVAIKEFFMQGINDRDESTGSITINIEQNRQQFIEQLEKFKKEALRIRKLNNEHIVRVHDLFEENGTAYYVMDFIDGESLSERLKRTGKPMTEEEIRGILPQILDALKTVHSTGIWHLDLKPANIMLTKDGQVKLIDFGASKQLNAKKGGATTSTAISYTNGYAPREQMEQNYDKFGPWTDIYALGATIYTLLTNKRPPLPTNIDDDMSEDKHLALPLPDSISKDIKDLVLAMMHTNKNKRPQNVDAIMAILSDSNQKEEVCDVLSEETIIDHNRNGAKEEKKQDLVNNEKTQIDNLNKGFEKKSETKIKKLLLISITIISILGFVGWMLYNRADQKKSLFQTSNVFNNNVPISTSTPETLVKLYRNLTTDGYNLGSLNDFKEAMSDSTKAAKLYKNLSSDGYQLGSQEEFFEKVGNNSMSNSQQPASKHTLRTTDTSAKPINAKIKQLYDAMKADGDDVGTEQEFSDYFLAKGDQGYKNRKAVWDYFKAAGADVGENYEEFVKWLGLRPVKSVLKYQFFDKDGKSHTIDKSEYDTYSDDFAKQHPDISMRMVAPDGKSRMVPIANVKAAITKDGYRMWLMRVGSISSKKHIQLKTVSQDNIHLLYKELKDSYELGSENDFRKYLSDPRKREKLRKELEAEYDVGDFESFSKYLGFETSK